MAAYGRMRTLILVYFGTSERPLWRKAAVQTGASKNQVPSDWIALKSGRSTDRIVRGKNRPVSDVRLRSESVATLRWPVVFAKCARISLKLAFTEALHHRVKLLGC